MVMILPSLLNIYSALSPQGRTVRCWCGTNKELNLKITVKTHFIKPILYVL